MAIMHVRVRTGSRTNGQSAKAHACYVLREGKYRGISERRGTEEAVSVGHANMPSWAVQSPVDYWAAADEHERANGRLFTSVEVALPRELNPAQRVELVGEFVRQLVTENLPEGESRPVTWAVHDSPDHHNPHLHIVLSERTSGTGERDADDWFRRAPTGAPKRPLKSRDYIPHVREVWELMTNEALERAGSSARVDRRSYLEQGIEKVPGAHLGPARHRAVRERRQGRSPSQIVGQDQILRRTLQVRHLQGIQDKIEALECELATLQPPQATGQSTTNQPGGNPMSNQTNRPDSATDIRRREQAEHEKWVRLDQRRRDQIERDELAEKHRREQRAGEERRLARQRQAEAEQAEIERQLGVRQSDDRANLAGSSQAEIEQAGNRATRPAQLLLTGYIARRIVTQKGYEAVAYSRPGQQGPELVDYGSMIVGYGATTPAEQRDRARAMINLGKQKGWTGLRVWGGESWLKESYLEARRTGFPWSVDAQRTDFLPDQVTLEAWAQEAEAEAAEQGASAGEDTSGTTKKAAEGAGEQPAEEQKENRFAGWTREQMLTRLQELRRKHGQEFLEDDEPEAEGPSLGL